MQLVLTVFRQQEVLAEFPRCEAQHVGYELTEQSDLSDQTRSSANLCNEQLLWFEAPGFGVLFQLGVGKLPVLPLPNAHVLQTSQGCPHALVEADLTQRVFGFRHRQSQQPGLASSGCNFACSARSSSALLPCSVHDSALPWSSWDGCVLNFCACSSWRDDQYQGTYITIRDFPQILADGKFHLVIITVTEISELVHDLYTD